MAREHGVPRKNKGYPYFVCIADGRRRSRVDFSEPTTPERRADLDTMFTEIHAAVRKYFRARDLSTAPATEAGCAGCRGGLPFVSPGMHGDGLGLVVYCTAPEESAPTPPASTPRAAVTEAMRAFIAEAITDHCAHKWWQDADLQEKLEKHGFLEPFTVKESCGEWCECSEGDTCYRVSTIGQMRALAPDAGTTGEDDASEPVTMCESGCGPAYGSDPDGVPLCAQCIAEGNAELLREIGALVGWEEGTDIVDAVRARLAARPEES